MDATGLVVLAAALVVCAVAAWWLRTRNGAVRPVSDIQGTEEGAVPESANRQMRRQAERMQQQARGGRPGGSASRKRKRK